MSKEMLKLKCVRCGAEWYPRVEKPVRCPRCQSYHWDTPPQKDKAEVQNE